MCRCAGVYDAAAESAACPPLLQEFVEAAYLLPQSVGHDGLCQEEACDELPQEAHCLELFHGAMLPPHPMQTRLTSCACLLRFLAGEIADPDEPSEPYGGWCSYEGILDDICMCLLEGLEVSRHQS